MAAKKRRTLTTPARIVLCFLLAAGTLLILLDCGNDVLTMFKLKQSIAANKEDAAALQDQLDTLGDLQEKMKDPEYLKLMARGKYLVTKEGIQDAVFQRRVIMHFGNRMISGNRDHLFIYKNFPKRFGKCI